MKKRKPTYLYFAIGKETFAASTNNVLEVLEPQYITPVPNSNDFIKGVIAFRGNIIPVIELKHILKLISKPSDANYIIIVFDFKVNNHRTTIAAVADNVREVVAASDDEILKVPEKGIVFNPDFLSGMLKTGDYFSLVLNVEKVLAYD